MNDDSTITVGCLAHTSLVAADMVVLSLTWIKTFHLWRQSRRLNTVLPFTTCLLRDGKKPLFYSEMLLLCGSTLLARHHIFCVSY